MIRLGMSSARVGWRRKSDSKRKCLLSSTKPLEFASVAQDGLAGLPGCLRDRFDHATTASSRFSSRFLVKLVFSPPLCPSSPCPLSPPELLPRETHIYIVEKLAEKAHDRVNYARVGKLALASASLSAIRSSLESSRLTHQSPL